MEPENKLEQEFQAIFEAHNEEIQEKIRGAAKLIDEAVALSEKYALPFRPEEALTFIKPSYIPESYMEKFASSEDDDGCFEDFVLELTDASGYEAGWQYSQTC